MSPREYQERLAAMTEAAASAVRAVCPHVHGLRINDPLVPTTWMIEFADAATGPERVAARRALLTIEPEKFGLRASRRASR